MGMTAIYRDFIMNLKTILKIGSWKLLITRPNHKQAD